MRTPVAAILVFSASAIVGPLIRAATWPPSKTSSESSLPIGDFIHDLVSFLWPAQPLAVIEVNSGLLVAIVVSVGANILLFAIVGTVAGFLARSRLALLTLYIAVCASVLLLALWSAGSIEDISMPPIAIALMLYVLPFWVIARHAKVAATHKGVVV